MRRPVSARARGRHTSASDRRGGAGAREQDDWDDGLEADLPSTKLKLYRSVRAESPSKLASGGGGSASAARPSLRPRDAAARPESARQRAGLGAIQHAFGAI